MAHRARGTEVIDPEKQDPFASLDGRKQSTATGEDLVTVETLRDADEALSFLENHPRSAQIAEEGNAILEDPQQLKKLVRKIDLTIAPLLACVYFLQFLDKTTLSYTAVMGIRTDTHLKGQDYSNLSMLFYIEGFLAAEFPTQYLAQRISRLGLYLGLNIMTWGLILGFHGACTTYAGLSVVRTLLGVFESCGTQNAHIKLSQSLILTAPTGAIGAVVVLSIGYLSDKWRDRSLVMIIVIIPTIISGCLMIGLDPNGVPKNKGGLLAASFLSGTFGAAFMLLLAWNASNIAGHSKKVTANALTLVAFAVGNILGTQTFQQKEAPGYKSGKISIIATLSALILVVIALRLYNDRLNKVNQKALAGMSAAEKVELKEKMAFADQTDRKNPFFVSSVDSLLRICTLDNATWSSQAHLDDDEHITLDYRVPYSNIDIDFILWIDKPVDRQSLELAILSGQRFIRNRIISQGEDWIQPEDDPFVSVIPDEIWLRNDSSKTYGGRRRMTYTTLLRVYEAYWRVLFYGKRNCEASMQIKVANVIAGHAALSTKAPDPASS
ncbi:MAG: hypothetical protein Q9202_006899 [Teloschistes flavicans]